MAWAWWDGAWLEAGLTPQDRGFALGDGLFETMLWEEGGLVAGGRHARRLTASAAALGLPAPPAAQVIAALAGEVVARNGLQKSRAAVRVAWTAGEGPRGLLRAAPVKPGLAVSAAPAAPVVGPARLATVAIRRNETAPTTQHKTLSYLDNVMARRAAADLGADEAALLNTAGRLAGGASSNIVLVVDGRALTPPTGEGALSGTVRAALLEVGVLEERLLTGAEIALAEAAALTNALLPVRPVAAWDGRTLDPAHPLMAALLEAALRRS